MTDKVEQEKDSEVDDFSWVKPKIEYPVRPWVRYCARNMDIFLSGFPFGVIIVFVAPFLLKMPEFVLGIIILPFWAIVEALLMSTWGYPWKMAP